MKIQPIISCANIECAPRRKESNGETISKMKKLGCGDFYSMVKEQLQKLDNNEKEKKQ
jgi:hypothetical protein